uniref:Uncharacterized protein n=1 Tax=Anguilla anguilla TaxID=7936 RepID=A0A0E9WPF2_ANGAN
MFPKTYNLDSHRYRALTGLWKRKTTEQAPLERPDMYFLALVQKPPE